MNATAIRLLLMLLQDEENRKRLAWIIGIPLICIIIFITCIQAIFTSSAEELAEMFGGEETYATIQEVLDEYGYYYNGIRPDVEFGDFSNTDAIDPEAFENLMEEATKYIGRPYVWGGSNPTEGFDCSGFVCWSFTKSGTYYLPRTTAQNIFNQCVPLPREEAVAGDLIFFTDTYETSNPVSHVGIYIGNGIMLHCGDPIGYASIDTAYWQKHFYAFGRLSDEEETR